MNDVAATIRSYFDAINRRDREAWISCFAADSVAFDPVGGPERRGHDAHRAFFDQATAAFASAVFTTGPVHVCGNEAAVSFRISVRSHSGKTATTDGIDVFQLDSAGRIATVRAFWDPSVIFVVAG